MTDPSTGNGNDSQHPLDYMFRPRSVALAGATTDPVRQFINGFYIEPLLKMGFPVKVYAINPKDGV